MPRLGAIVLIHVSNTGLEPTTCASCCTLQFVMTIPSSAVTSLADAAAVVDMWDRVLDAMADLVVMSRDRPLAERITLDCDIGGGWMHSGE